MKKVLRTVVNVITFPIALIGFGIYKGVQALNKKPPKARW